MTSAGPVASPGFGVTVRKALDHLTLSDFTVFDWTQSSPADSERTTAVCTLIGSGIAEVDNGVVQLKETATISSCHTAFGYCAKTLSLDTILALTLVAMWQPQIVCGLIDLVIKGLFVPMSATEADVVIATLRLILLLAASPTLSLPGYQGARSRIIVFCLELLHPLPPASFLQRISSNVQLQLVMLITLAFQASSQDCCNEMLRCTLHTQWLSRLGVELQKTGPHLKMPNVLLALFCLRPLQAAIAELLPFVTMPVFAMMVQPDVLADCEVADVLLSAMRAYAGICLLDNPLLSPNGTLSKVCLASCGLSNSPFLAYAAYVTGAEATDNIQQLCSLLKNLQGVGVVHNQEAVVDSVSSSADNNTFFNLLMATFGTVESPRVVTMLPRRPITVVMLEACMSKRLAEHSANQLALGKLHKQQSKLQSQLDCDAESLNTERSFFDLPVPARKTEGNYALQCFTFSSVGPSAVVDLQACNDQATAYVEDSDAWEFDEMRPDNLSDFV
ncbi:MAG: hypothetical protein FRX49_03898 [Trebouxia sp. A1-2]|nr:MAG: hypothetical protein FRX49_03898 [Trebouxia sp. A1-2]